MHQIHKYPRTQHIAGSRIQPGDEDLDAVPFSQITDHNLVVEEKVDGANCGLSFTAAGELPLQSRGHFLTGGPREKHFDLFKQWATTHQVAFFERLCDRYVMYGEWLYAKHTIFYDALPHYFMEFDVLDVESGQFLSTDRRADLLVGLPIVSVRVLFAGRIKRKNELASLLGQSQFIRPGHLERLGERVRSLDFDADRVLRQTDRSTKMEGLYIKVEEHGIVCGRYKYIRPDFLTAVAAADGHWLNRPIVPNMLDQNVDIFVSQIE
jgi:hypothetical protein